MTKSLLLVFALALAACDGGSLPPPAAPSPLEPTVIVATYLNSISGDHTEDRIATLLFIEHIQWTAVGSLGMTLHVNASQADRARELLRTVPNVDVL